MGLCIVVSSDLKGGLQVRDGRGWAGCKRITIAFGRVCRCFILVNDCAQLIYDAVLARLLSASQDLDNAFREIQCMSWLARQETIYRHGYMRHLRGDTVYTGDVHCRNVACALYSVHMRQGLSYGHLHSAGGGVSYHLRRWWTDDVGGCCEMG